MVLCLNWLISGFDVHGPKCHNDRLKTYRKSWVLLILCGFFILLLRLGLALFKVLDYKTLWEFSLCGTTFSSLASLFAMDLSSSAHVSLGLLQLLKTLELTHWSR